MFKTARQFDLDIHQINIASMDVPMQIVQVVESIKERGQSRTFCSRQEVRLPGCYNWRYFARGAGYSGGRETASGPRAPPRCRAGLGGSLRAPHEAGRGHRLCLPVQGARTQRLTRRLAGPPDEC